MKDLGYINNNHIFKTFLKCLTRATHLCIHFRNLNRHGFRKRATYPSIQTGLRATSRSTECGKFDHLCKKAPNKRKKVQKRKYSSTDEYIIDVTCLYPVPLFQIFFRKLKLKFQDTSMDTRGIGKGA